MVSLAFALVPEVASETIFLAPSAASLAASAAVLTALVMAPPMPEDGVLSGVFVGSCAPQATRRRAKAEAEVVWRIRFFMIGFGIRSEEG